MIRNIFKCTEKLEIIFIGFIIFIIDSGYELTNLFVLPGCFQPFFRKIIGWPAAISVAYNTFAISIALVLWSVIFFSFNVATFDKN